MLGRRSKHTPVQWQSTTLAQAGRETRCDSYPCGLSIQLVFARKTFKSSYHIWLVKSERCPTELLRRMHIHSEGQKMVRIFKVSWICTPLPIYHYFY